MKQQQRGSTFVGFILGLIVGLGIAFAVATYVTKIPVPLLNRSNTRPPGQDAAEAQRNKNWDPNAPLYGKNPAPTPNTPASTTAEAVSSDDPLGDLARQRATTSPTISPATTIALAPTANPEQSSYFVQAGAFSARPDAEAQRARLAMLGWQAQVSGIEQNGRPFFRVRIGPFARRDDAETLKSKLADDGMNTVLVLVKSR